MGVNFIILFVVMLSPRPMLFFLFISSKIWRLTSKKIHDTNITMQIERLRGSLH